MIDPNTIHINYIKKEVQTGSYCGMRYRFARGKNKDGDCMDVTVWPEPFCFFKTPDDQKQTRQFPLTLQGREDAAAWLNDMSSRFLK